MVKPIKYITTFSQTGYDVYGKSWLDSFIKYSNHENVSVDLYIDFAIDRQTLTDNINVIDFNTAIPGHRKWLVDFESQTKISLYNRKMAKRFSYKSFVMQHALTNNCNCYLIWLDGDCIFKNEQDYTDFPHNLLNNNAIAVQREHNGGNDHCESGIVVFDVDHIECAKFTNQFIENYRIQNVVKMDSPYDGFIIYKSLNGISYTDLNEGYGISGIQSDPNCTFLHPEIQKRYLHNIGPAGKSNYANFERHAKTDEFFKLLHGRITKSPEEIRDIRQKLAMIRNGKN